MGRLHAELLTSTRLPGLVLFPTHPGTRGNGNGHDHHHHHHHGGNGHAKSGAVKVMKHRKPQMKNGLNQAACRALGAVLLMHKCNLTIAQAISCTGSCTDYIGSMKWIVAQDDPSLVWDVLHGQIDIFDAAAKVRPQVEMKTAYSKLTPEQRINWAAEANPTVLFDEVIGPAATAAAAKQKAAELISIIN